jgi:NhaP-type Na+/H+ or K+/H+ antiporter
MDQAERILIALAGILVLGVAILWLAWRIRLPAVLLLLAGGFLAGPVAGIVDPEWLLGDLLLPIESARARPA